MAQLSPLRRRMIEDMTVRNMSPSTQQSYISAGSKFSRYFGKSPELLDLEDVRASQVHLVSKGSSWPGLSQIVCALRFFFGVTLDELTNPLIFIDSYLPELRPRGLVDFRIIQLRGRDATTKGSI